MATAVLAQKLPQPRCPGAHLVALGALAVEDPQRVDRPLVAVLVAEFVSVGLEVSRQLLSIARPALGVTERVDSKAQGAEAEIAVEPCEEGNDLDIGHRVLGAKGLDAELVVLTEAAGLGALVAEHRRHVPGLKRWGRRVLHESAYDRRRALGT